MSKEINETIDQIRAELENLMSESYKTKHSLTIDSKSVRLAKRFLGEIYPGCKGDRLDNLYRVLAEGGSFGTKLTELLDKLFKLISQI